MNWHQYWIHHFHARYKYQNRVPIWPPWLRGAKTLRVTILTAPASFKSESSLKATSGSSPFIFPPYSDTGQSFSLSFCTKQQYIYLLACSKSLIRGPPFSHVGNTAYYDVQSAPLFIPYESTPFTSLNSIQPPGFNSRMNVPTTYNVCNSWRGWFRSIMIRVYLFPIGWQ